MCWEIGPPILAQVPVASYLYKDWFPSLQGGLGTGVRQEVGANSVARSRVPTTLYWTEFREALLPLCRVSFAKESPFRVDDRLLLWLFVFSDSLRTGFRRRRSLHRGATPRAVRLELRPKSPLPGGRAPRGCFRCLGKTRWQATVPPRHLSDRFLRRRRPANRISSLGILRGAFECSQISRLRVSTRRDDKVKETLNQPSGVVYDPRVSELCPKRPAPIGGTKAARCTKEEFNHTFIQL